MMNIRQRCAGFLGAVILTACGAPESRPAPSRVVSIRVTAGGILLDSQPVSLDQLNEALKKPEVIEKLENLGLKPLYGDVKAAQELVRAETAEKKRVIELIGLKRE